MKTRTPSPWLASSFAFVVAALLAFPAQAASPGAKLGPLSSDGTLSAGGTISFGVRVYATTPGATTSQGTIKGKGWKANFDLVTGICTVGTNYMASTTLPVPASYQGKATLNVKTTFNGKKLGKQSLTVVIGPALPPPPPPPTPTTLYDVGFNKTVTLNAGVASTNGLGPITSYTWTQTSGPSAALSNAATATPSFTTLAITNFFTQAVNQGDDTFIYVTGLPDGQLGPLAISAEQQDDSTYGFRVIVSDGAKSSTGTVTVVSASINRGQNSAPLGIRQYFIAPTNLWKWTLAGVPTGSTATLENTTTRTPSLRPDKEGEYTLYCYTVTSGVTNYTTLVEKGATYVGISTCAGCHGPNPQVGLSDLTTPFQTTLHSTMAQRGVDGVFGSHYSESCFKCHTLGYDKAEDSNGFNNNGFDDVETALGWTFPTVLQSGNYAAMPAALQDKANIQCESCHGPGSQHPGSDSITFEPQLCASCHEEATHHVHPAEWELSPHNGNYLEVSQSEGLNSSCAKCHSPAGFVDSTRGVNPIRLVVGELSCQTCHDPHNSKMFPLDAHQVRIYDSVTLDSGVSLTGKGPAALCMNCHNSRRSPANFMTTFTHESSATDILLGFGGVTNLVLNGTNVWSGATNIFANVTNAITTASSAHSTVADCITCHMYNSGSTTVGVHTFSMTDRITGAQNLAACNQCHAGVDPVSDFDHVSQHAQDYDGDGSVDGIQTEVTGLMNIVSNKLVSTGVTVSDGYPFGSGFSTNIVMKTAQRAATWNLALIQREQSHGVHNSRYTVELLQFSYTILGQVTDGHTFTQDYPQAYIW